MKRLPLVIGMGGINASGRTSFHQGFRRIVIDKLNQEARQETFVGLATLMNLVKFEDGKLLNKEGGAVAPADIEKYYGEHTNVIPYFWMPSWSEGVTDASARELDIY